MSEDEPDKIINADFSEVENRAWVLTRGMSKAELMHEMYGGHLTGRITKGTQKGPTEDKPKRPEDLSHKDDIAIRELLGEEIPLHEYYTADTVLKHYADTMLYGESSEKIYYGDLNTPKETKHDPKPAKRVGVQMQVDPRKGYVLPRKK